MRLLLATTCLSPVALAVTPASAQSVIDTARTTPVRSSTVKNGAADNIRIAAAGSVKPTTGAAVTLDSANTVTNEGTVGVTNADGATGISAVGGGQGGITNAASGKIIVDETYEGTDIDKDGDIDGPFATGSGRAGIRTLGQFTGNIANNGAVTVEGNDSAGIALGGRLTGAFTTDGSVAVTGDRSVGVALGEVTGPVRLAGTISARGKDAVGVLVGGDLSGALVVQGGIGSTGYRSTTPPSDVSKLDGDDLLQGGPALSIAANVAGGVILAVPPKDASSTDNDEDKDGLEDAKEGSAAVTSFGSAAAVQVGAADRAVTLGPVAGTGSGHGLVIDGNVAGQGVYSGVAANAVVIGGQGGAVSLSNGMTVNGAVQATASGANATAVRIGAGASVPEIRITGTVGASGGGSTGHQSTAILVGQGAQVTTIRNSGTVKAVAAGADGGAAAIVDRSGAVTLVENSGAISASGAAATSDRNVAIDLSASATGVTVRQTAVAPGVAAPTISGDILLGAGNDVVEVADGGVSGTLRFGAGNNRLALTGDGAVGGRLFFGSGHDAVTLAGSSTFSGTADFGGGADTLTIGGTARFTGSLVNAGALAVQVSGGTLDLGTTGSAAIGSLVVGAQGTLGVTIDTATGAATRYQVAGNASFAEGSKLDVRLTGIANAEGRFTVLTAGSLSGTANLTASGVTLPFLYKSALATGGPANEIAIDIKRKTSTELGLNRSAASAYNAVYAALGQDAKVAGAILSIRDGDAFRSTLRSMLPNHAGGAFESVTSGSRATARFLTDGGAPLIDKGRWGYRLETVAFGRAKSIGDTASYDIGGWGASGGGEIKSKFGNLGVSLAYLQGQDKENGTASELLADQYEAALYWRADWSGFRPFARISAAHVDFHGQRRFDGSIGNEAVSRVAKGKWNGQLYSATGGFTYLAEMGAFTLRPTGSVDWHRLSEDAYRDQGGGKAFDLIVDRRTSDEVAANGTVALGWISGQVETGWFHAEVEGGRREIVSGDLGATTARFEGGQPFTLTPEARTSGWVARLRGVGGNEFFRVAGEVSGEEQQGRAAIGARVTLQIGL